MPGFFLIVDATFHLAKKSIPQLVLSGVIVIALMPGCGSPNEGVIDLDTAREKAIAEGKPDPTAVAPTTPEARKERADKLLQESREQVAKKSRK